jgi:hypothetical protein
MRFFTGMTLGIAITMMGALLASPVRWTAPDRDWAIFLESRRKGIDVMNSGTSPPSELVARNRAAFNRLLSSGEIVTISVRTAQIDKVMVWMRKHGIQQEIPLDILEGGQNLPNNIKIPKSAMSSLLSFVNGLP